MHAGAVSVARDRLPSTSPPRASSGNPSKGPVVVAQPGDRPSCSSVPRMHPWAMALVAVAPSSRAIWKSEGAATADLRSFIEPKNMVGNTSRAHPTLTPSCSRPRSTSARSARPSCRNRQSHTRSRAAAAAGRAHATTRGVPSRWSGTLQSQSVSTATTVLSKITSESRMMPATVSPEASSSSKKPSTSSRRSSSSSLIPSFIASSSSSCSFTMASTWRSDRQLASSCSYVAST
mmetsp:Transcript_7717/g.21894  ORF Transcript_7717/g.21894 Transcript_7717/m.21894 type:complete len:234 (-) Transcript_7717:411-1112(-)